MKKLGFILLCLAMSVTITSCSQLKIEKPLPKNDTNAVTSNENVTKQETKAQVTTTNRNEEASVGEDEVFNYLDQNVPEIAQFDEQISKASNGQVRSVMRLDNIPDESSNDVFRNYYIVYVGENQPDHMVRWNSFYIHKDLNEILVEDVITGDVVTLEKWRELYKERGY